MSDLNMFLNKMAQQLSNNPIIILIRTRLVVLGTNHWRLVSKIKRKQKIISDISISVSFTQIYSMNPFVKVEKCARTF